MPADALSLGELDELERTLADCLIDARMIDESRSAARQAAVERLLTLARHGAAGAREARQQDVADWTARTFGHAHKLRLPLGAGTWTATGEFPDTLTVMPSINADHVNEETKQQSCGWHGFIKHGGVA